MNFNRYWSILFSTALTSLNMLVTTQIAIAESKIQQTFQSQCPQDLESLAKLMVTKIDNYGNRVMQKSSIYSHELDFLPTYIVTAGKPEIQPLSLEQSQYPSANIDDGVEQIFFTTLERQYGNKQRIIETQNYHWLIITQTPEGWKLVMALTRFGYPQDDRFLASPPRDTTHGVIGQAVKLWLKDCQAGTIR